MSRLTTLHSPSFSTFTTSTQGVVFSSCHAGWKSTSVFTYNLYSPPALGTERVETGSSASLDKYTSMYSFLGPLESDFEHDQENMVMTESRTASLIKFLFNIIVLIGYSSKSTIIGRWSEGKQKPVPYLVSL